ncbi:MAG: peptide-binding protein [Nitrospirae bacterium]|nr:peptide-binding protein [Nitrospirota bacterium]
MSGAFRRWLAPGFAAALAACDTPRAPTELATHTAGAGADSRDGDVFVEASIGDASQLNPVLAKDASSGDINDLVYSGLLRYGPDLQVEGVLAERWDVGRGGLEITFHLRRGVRWHDGVPFSSADVLYTYEKLRDPKVPTPYSSEYDLVKEVRAPDANTVVVAYREPFAPALESWMMGVLPKHVYEAKSFACPPTPCRPEAGPAKTVEDFVSHPANRCPIGTGPYKFCEWRTDEKVVLEANPDYFEGRPHIQRYIYRVIPDQAVQFLELRRESVDSMGLRPDQYRAYDVFFEAYRKYRYPSFSYTYLGFNLRKPMFQDRRVRLAVARAIDKDELIEGVLMGLGRAATGPFPPMSWAYDPGIEDFAYDLEEARRLLDEAGWKDSDGDGIRERDGVPFRFEVMTNQGNKTRELTAQVLQQQLRRIGLDVKIRIVEWSAFIQHFVEPRAFEVVILGWSLGRDPDQYLIWHSSQDGEGKYNFVGYRNEEADALWVKGRTTFDKAEREKTYRRIHRLIHDDLPYVFLYYPEATPVVHRRFEGPEVRPAGLTWNFIRWFVPAEKRRYRTQVSANG